MPVPEASRVAEAVELLRPVLGEQALVATYRLLRTELGRARGVAVEDEAGVGPDLRRTALELLSTEAGPPDDVRGLADLHQSLMLADRRKAAGAWFTPRVLIEHLLDEALEPALDDATSPADVTVLDPACGSGLFLAAAMHRFLRRGVAAAHVLRHCLHGVELDPAAAELTRLSLWLTALDAGTGTDLPEAQVEIGDALESERPGVHDVVVGNPPFLNRLERRTAQDPERGRRLAAESNGAVRAYTDLSAVFLHRAVSWVRPGGRVAMVQPQSLLAARDAAGVRAAVTSSCSLDSLWASDHPVFEAGVLTCAPVLRRDGRQGRVRRSHGPACEPSSPVEPGDLAGTWSHLVAQALGVPPVVWSRPAGPVGADASAQGALGDVADCTADFRDQYYGLRPHVHEAEDCPGGAPLVTTGLIDPALNAWGARPTRFLKRTWAAPVVDLGSLADDDRLAAWGRSRLVPKVLLGTQGRVVEAVVDEQGEWLPSVPTITVVPRSVSLWHVLAVLLAPPVAAHAATTYAGAGLTMRSIKLSARQVAELPLPCPGAVWDQAAETARRAQHEPGARRDRLVELGRLMCVAYDVPPDEVLPWWLERLPVDRPVAGGPSA